MSERDPRLSQLLQQQDLSEPNLQEELLQLTYEELRGMAAGQMRRERPGQTLQATALVHEAYVRLVDGNPQWQSRAHFFGAAGEAMRRILVDRARSRMAEKRGGDAHRVTLGEFVESADEPNLDLLALDEALDELAKEDERLAKIVHLRFFVSLSVAEAAEVLGISTATVKRDWQYARAWLLERMNPDE